MMVFVQSIISYNMWHTPEVCDNVYRLRRRQKQMYLFFHHH